MKNIEAVRKFFQADKFVTYAGIEIVSVDDDKAVVSAEITERHLNANGTVQGGMLYTIADFAFAVLENYKHPITVTQNGNISYVNAVGSSRITATATELLRKGHNTVCDVTVTADDGAVLCVCRFNGFVKDLPKKIFE
ncbi:MAG: PaaI family thioesterase [Clostridia bacterium]|nr:PaaI family thioesterase [Clostridia bacterium]